MPLQMITSFLWLVFAIVFSFFFMNKQRRILVNSPLSVIVQRNISSLFVHRQAYELVPLSYLNLKIGLNEIE